MTDEPRYTLDEAQAVLLQQKCALREHRPIIFTDDGTRGLCECGNRIWSAAPADLQGRRDALRELAAALEAGWAAAEARGERHLTAAVAQVRTNLAALGVTENELRVAGIE
jgi:hypothetical protein